MSDTVQYPQFSAEGLPLTYVPDPQKADGKPVDSQWKQPVRVATAGNITLSGLQTIDGVGVMEGDRVLVKDQINPAENGIWIASAGNWYRAPDMRFWEQAVSAVVAVEEGAGPGEEVWITSVSTTGTIGTTAINWITVASATGTIPTYTALRALVTNAVGEPAASPTTAQEIAFVSGVTSSIQTQFAALTSKANGAYSIAQTGTNLSAAAFAIAVDGTNAAASAQSTADSAFDIAVDGTNASATAQSTANSAFSVATIGTNTGSAAYSYASQAYALAEAGTNIGSLAYTVATALGDKYVRTTRFASIGAGTSGAVALPANSTVVLDDFGGGVDAVITTISAGRPTFSHAFTAAGDLVTTGFDAGGNYTLSGAPSAYPVALVYRVRQKLSDFDSTSTDIIGDYDVEGINVVQGTANQVYINGSVTPQYGNAVFSLPQNIAQSSAVMFGSVFASGSATTPLLNVTHANINHIHFDLSGGTVPRQEGCLRWDADDATLEVDLAGTAVTLQIGQETLLYARNDTSSPILNGKVVYVSGATGDVPNISLANNNVRAQARAVVGVTTEYIPNGSRGYVCLNGLVRGLDTSGMIVGRPVFLTTNGNYSMTAPTAPASTVFVGVVTRVNPVDGIIYVIPRPVDALNELQDVNVSTRQVGDHLVYNGTIWVNEAGTTTSPTFQVSTVTAGTTIVPAVPAIRRVYLADTSSGPIVVALPNSTGWTGQMVHVKKKTTDGQRVTVRSATGTATVDGSLEQWFTAPYMSIQVTTDGNNWYIV